MKAIKTHNWIYGIGFPWCTIKMLFPRNWRYPNLYCRLITASFSRTGEGEFSSVRIAWTLIALNFLDLQYCQEIINITFNNFRYFWFWTPILLFMESWLQKKHTQCLYLDSVYKELCVLPGPCIRTEKQIMWFLNSSSQRVFCFWQMVYANVFSVLLQAALMEKWHFAIGNNEYSMHHFLGELMDSLCSTAAAILYFWGAGGTAMHQLLALPAVFQERQFGTLNCKLEVNVQFLQSQLKGLLYKGQYR